MIRDITIGQYYPAPSALHRLDPRVKFVWTVIYIVALFLVNSWGFILCTAVLAVLIGLSKVPFSYMVKGLKAIVIIMVITMLINMLLTPGEPLLQWQIFTITKEGLRMALLMAIRLIYIILGTSLMTLTTTPNQLTNGLEALFSPLRHIKVPVSEIAMMMSIALRFIPILLDEADKIIKAQMARGADFEKGGLIKKIKSYVPLFVPLFISAFRRANDLALAMEARCYHGGGGRTQMKPLRYKRADLICYFLMAAFLAAVIVGKIFINW